MLDLSYASFMHGEHEDKPFIYVLRSKQKQLSNKDLNLNQLKIRFDNQETLMKWLKVLMKASKIESGETPDARSVSQMISRVDSSLA